MAKPSVFLFPESVSRNELSIKTSFAIGGNIGLRIFRLIRLLALSLSVMTVIATLFAIGGTAGLASAATDSCPAPNSLNN
jgi:hypothetical protein